VYALHWGGTDQYPFLAPNAAFTSEVFVKGVVGKMLTKHILSKVSALISYSSGKQVIKL